MTVATVDLFELCVTCDLPVPPGATRCECGERLVPHLLHPDPLTPLPATVVSVPVPHGCKCHGGGTCQACIFASYDGDAL